MSCGVASCLITVSLVASKLLPVGARPQVCCIPGTTLLIDFPFSAFPENLGYWAELLLPLYGVLRTAGWTQYLKGGSTGIDRIMLTNVQKLMYDWPRQVLQLAVAGALSNSSSGRGGNKQRELQLLEERELYSYCQAGWVVFENLLVVKDRYWDYTVAEQRRKVVYRLPAQAGQPSLFDRSQHVVGFASTKDYDSFRAAAHQQVMWPLQPPKGRPVVTVLLYPEGYPAVVNHHALVHMLEDMFEPHGFQVSCPGQSQLCSMACSTLHKRHQCTVLRPLLPRLPLQTPTWLYQCAPCFNLCHNKLPRRLCCRYVWCL